MLSRNYTLFFDIAIKFGAPVLQFANFEKLCYDIYENLKPLSLFVDIYV